MPSVELWYQAAQLSFQMFVVPALVDFSAVGRTQSDRFKTYKIITS
jgi:hypothetical protein